VGLCGEERGALEYTRVIKDMYMGVKMRVRTLMEGVKGFPIYIRLH